MITLLHSVRERKKKVMASAEILIKKIATHVLLPTRTGLSDLPLPMSLILIFRVIFYALTLFELLMFYFSQDVPWRRVIQ